MAKENTHIHFALSLLEKSRTNFFTILGSGLESFYCLGSILPDTMYFSTDQQGECLAKELHGHGRTPLDKIITECIEICAATQNATDMAIICGWATHLALDAALHPAIDSLSGDYDDPDPIRRRKAQYTHRLLETILDSRINPGRTMLNRFKLTQLDRSNLPNFLTHLCNLDPGALKAAMKRHIHLNKLFLGHWGYWYACTLHRLKLKDLTTILPLFYAHATKAKLILPQMATFIDPSDGNIKQRSFPVLFQAAETMAKTLLDLVIDRYLSPHVNTPPLSISKTLQLPL